MTSPWPEEEPLASRLGGVFDEAMRPPETYQEQLKRLRELARKLRVLCEFRGEPVPKVIEQLERNWARGMLAGHIMRGAAMPECARAWLRERYPSGETRLDGFEAHWRTCATCQAPDDD